MEEAFPYYLSIGMSAYEYWEGDPYIVKSYQKAHELKIEMRNQEMWLQGLYNYQATKSALEAFGYALAGGKGSKPKGYIEYPLPVTEREKKEARKREVEKTISWFKQGQN